NDSGMTHFHSQPHYRLRLGDVPFVAGKSTSPSHSVTANVQHVLHLMKQHSKALCNSRVVSEAPMSKPSSRGRRASTSSLSSTSQGDLSEVLLTLQDELGQMSFQHQHLAKLIHEAATMALRRDLEKDLEVLVKKMEAKAEQINKIQRHRARLEKLKVSKTKQHGARDCCKAGEEKKVKEASLKRKPVGQGKKNLQLLRDMQSIQTSLQKDDISWDC
ncbi:PREDICTED: centrosomal protein of 57 kDa-like, partial [Thamnophis sirtalis]|uniref:Centrosomal protein of 57 kDa-like n=2 Tax=Thamnophis TaxID=34999 RepID=A0A6I9Y8Z0_9SAUR